MIIDTLDNIEKYALLSENIKKGIGYLKEILEKGSPLGRTDFDNGIYTSVTSYDTKNPRDAKWETHEKFIDIQFIVEGGEIIGYAPKADLGKGLGYDEKKDIEFFTYEGDYTPLKLVPGTFAIFFPEDGHKACVRDRSATAKKLLVKVPL